MMQTGKIKKHESTELSPLHCIRYSCRVSTAQGKQGIWFAQVVISLIQKVKDISKFTAKISNLFLKLDTSTKSDLWV